MEIPKNVRRIPSWVDHILFFNTIAGGVLYPYIFLKHEYYDDLHSGHPKSKTLRILIHEQTHLMRMKKAPIVWISQYLLSPSFRINEELAAEYEAMKYWRQKGLDYDLDRMAKSLSGPHYFFSISYEDAKSRLSELWHSL